MIKLKKLFKAIRQSNLDEVKSILEKNPNAVNEIASAPPKKDEGLSPLQVAIKTGELEIAFCLIENGADIHFMDAKDEHNSFYCPILHDAINSALTCLCYGRDQIELSNQSIELIRYLLKHGVDPNICNSTGFDAWGYTIEKCEGIITSAHDEVEDLVIYQTYQILDMLIEHHANKDEWPDKHYLIDMEETNKECYLGEFVPKPDWVNSFTIRGKKHEVLVKGDIDSHAKMRELLKKYY